MEFVTNSFDSFVIEVLITKSRVKGELRNQINSSCTCTISCTFELAADRK